MRRLLDYDGRRYWLANGWSIRFRIAEAEVTAGRPHGIKYAFTLHDVDRTRLLGFPTRTGFRERKPTIIGIAFVARQSWCLMISGVRTS